jgi:branched-chain amino acid transport system permease protein
VYQKLTRQKWGAYTHVLLQRHAHLPFGATLLGACIAAGIVGFFLALLTRRIRKDEFQIFTLAFLYAIYALALGWDELTRGPLGFSGIRRPAMFRTDDMYFLLVFGVTLITGLLIWRVVRSSFGRLLEASRDDEQAVKSIGKDPRGAKIKAFIAASALSGLAGALVASQLRYIDPGTFYLGFLLLIIAMVLVGGLASLRGTLIGGALTFLLPSVLRFLPLPAQYLGPLRVIFFSLILLVFVMFRPKGLWGRVEVE